MEQLNLYWNAFYNSCRIPFYCFPFQEVHALFIISLVFFGHSLSIVVISGLDYLLQVSQLVSLTNVLHLQNIINTYLQLNS